MYTLYIIDIWQKLDYKMNYNMNKDNEWLLIRRVPMSMQWSVMEVISVKRNNRIVNYLFILKWLLSLF